MTQSVQAFCEWLVATPLSNHIQAADWVIPTVQTIHILSISIVMSGVTVVYLRILGILMPRESTAAVASRFLPWVWWSMMVLLLSGGTLIIGEPERSLRNPAFLVKMSMLAATLSLTLLFQRGLRRDALFWEASHGRRVGARLLAVLSLVLWVGIVVAGRWIAYVDVGAA